MTVSWTKLDDGEWGVCLQDTRWYHGTAAGFVVVVKSKAGRKTRVVLGECVRSWMPKGRRGRWTDIYRVERVCSD